MREKVALDLGENDPEKPFLEHLEDLRSMLVKMAMTVALLTLLTFCFYGWFLNLIQRPLNVAVLSDGSMLRPHVDLVFLDITGPFMTAMRVTMIAGIVLSFPLLLYFLLEFVLPGMRSTEKKMIFPALGVGAFLFLGGVIFAFFFVIPKALVFFYEFGIGIVQAHTPDGKLIEQRYIWNIVEYNKFVTQFCLIFGACFELPVVVMALVKIGILTYPVMKRTRSWAIIIIAVASAIIAPTGDVFTMSLLAVPMYVLYEICIWLAWYLDKKDRAANPEYYKALDENERIMESEEWDNESYNPWGGSKDDEEDDDLHHPKPAPVSPPAGTVAHEPSYEEQHGAAHDTPALNPPAPAPEPHVDPEHPAPPAPAADAPAVNPPVPHAETEHPEPPAADPATPVVNPPVPHAELVHPAAPAPAPDAPPAHPGLELPEPPAPVAPDHPVHPPIDLPASPGEQPAHPPVEPEHPNTGGSEEKPKAPEDPHSHHEG